MAVPELFEGLLQDPPGTHQFEAPADTEAIDAVETALKLKLPQAYRRLLRLSNGLHLFQSVQLLGVTPCAADIDLFARFTALQNASPPLPPRLIPFAISDDGIDCFLTSNGLQEREYPVAFWDGQSEGAETTHDALDDWLFELTEGMRELVDEENAKQGITGPPRPAIPELADDD